MLDDLNELKTFRAILAEGNLSAAARRLGVTLAVVSKRLSTLENRAGVRLVHRSTRCSARPRKARGCSRMSFTRWKRSTQRRVGWRAAATSQQAPCGSVLRSPSVAVA